MSKRTEQLLLEQIRRLLCQAIPTLKPEPRSEGAILYCFNVVTKQLDREPIGMLESPYQLQAERNGRLTLFRLMKEATEAERDHLFDILHAQVNEKGRVKER